MRLRGWRVLRDAAVVALVALVVFQLLRTFVGDYYRVPSGSMQPFLFGDTRRGDVVWVDAWSSPAAVGRGDVVVVRHPDDPSGQLVKRIAACGDDQSACWIELSDGDVLLGPDAQHLEREVKDPVAARGLRIPWARWPGSPAATAPLELAGNARMAAPSLALDVAALRALCGRRETERQRDGSPPPPGFIGTRGAVDATYLDCEGGRGREGEDVQVFDCGIDLRLRAGVDGLALLLETRAETFTFYWQPALGRVELWRDGVAVEVAELPVQPAGGHRIEFGRLDDRLFFVVEGRADAGLVVPRRPEWHQNRSGLPRGPRSRLFVAAVGARELALAELLVFRDIYYFRDRIPGVPGQPQDWPKFVDQGHWFLLGDNAFDSRDSRQFGALPATSYLGRPRLVLGPRPRTRWLQP